MKSSVETLTKVSVRSLPKSSVRLTGEEVKVYSNTLSNYSRVLSIILPTNNPEIFGSMFLQTLHNLKEISEFTTICLNLQSKDFDLNSIINRFEELGFSYRICYNEYDCSNGVPLNRMVDDACQIAPENSILFLRTDDDFLFYDKSDSVNKSSGQQYLDIIHYMLKNKYCGVVNTFGTSLCKFPGKYVIGPSCTNYNLKDFKDISYTGKGLFLRNICDEFENSSMKGHTLPSIIVNEDWTCGGEDILSAGIRTKLGYYTARCTHLRVRHVYQHSSNYKDPEFVDTYNWRNDEYGDAHLGEFVRRYFNPNYVFRHDTLSLVDPQVFIDNGGDPGLFKRDYCNSKCINYENTDSNIIAKEIKEIINNENSTCN